MKQQLQSLAALVAAILVLTVVYTLPPGCSTSSELRVPRLEGVWGKGDGGFLIENGVIVVQTNVPWSVRLRDAGGFAFAAVDGQAGFLVVRDVENKVQAEHDLSKGEPVLADWEVGPVQALRELLERERGTDAPDDPAAEDDPGP